MLTGLAIRNVVLIDRLELELGAGLTVLTGETGAGKSILLDSLGLGLGEKGDAGLLRAGESQASVSLTFQLPNGHAAYALLEEMGLREAGSGGELVLRRVLGRDGRSKAFVDDQPVAVGLLKKLGETLVEVHGQFEAHGLLNRETHLGFLDAFAGTRELAATTTQLYSAWQQASAAHQAAQLAAENLQRRAEDIALSIKELSTLAPQPGEADTLAAQRTELQGREKILGGVNSAYDEMSGDGGAQRQLNSARRTLVRAAEKAPTLLDGALEHLARAEDALAESAAALEGILARDGYDSGALERIEDRLFTLRAAARKYACQPDDLAALLERLEAEAAALDKSDAELKKLAVAQAASEKVFVASAEKLHAARTAQAGKLEAAVHAELPPLKLENARIKVQVEKLPLAQAGPNGISSVLFLAATNPGQPPAPLHKAASGGELARFMLALRLCLMQEGGPLTLVFDEVDTGIGGATASAVGERLARLAANLQTLVITHSPQVAARGTTQLKVAKAVQKGLTRTSVAQLDDSERREELARMLSGNVVTEAARQAADSLLIAPLINSKNKRKAQ